MWYYIQKTGWLLDHAGKLTATGYSGHDAGVNNPAVQEIRNVGPIPKGIYSLGAPIADHPTCGRFAIPLIPHSGDEMFGRSGFYIHGDDERHPGEEVASDGCIIMPPDARHQVWDSGDHTLTVL